MDIRRIATTTDQGIANPPRPPSLLLGAHRSVLIAPELYLPHERAITTHSYLHGTERVRIGAVFADEVVYWKQGIGKSIAPAKMKPRRTCTCTPPEAGLNMKKWKKENEEQKSQNGECGTENAEQQTQVRNGVGRQRDLRNT